MASQNITHPQPSEEISVSRQSNITPKAAAFTASRGDFRLAPIAAAAAITGLLAATQAQAADADDKAVATTTEEAPALDAVTVRSRNRIEKLQDVPLSISVVQGAELARLNAYSIEELTKRAGNVSWNLGNQRTSSISIRGIGKVGQTEAQDPSVGIIVDGVSYAYNALTSSFDFVDLDTVEVSRGPQGTLLGKNTSVGNIIFNTKKPSFTPSADFQLSFNPSQRGIQAWTAITGPVIDNVLAWRGTFSVSRSEGDLQNQYNKDVTYTNKDRVSGRVQFLFTPTDDFNAILRLDLQPRAAEATNGRSFSITNTHTYLDGSAIPVSSTSNEAKLARRWFSDLKSFSIDQYNNTITTAEARPLVTGSAGASLETNWKVADHTLTSITAYKNYHFDAYNDNNTPFDISRNSGGYWNDYKQVSEELRLSSKTGGFVDYQTGLYFIRAQNSATYNKGYGNDAGAWNANKTQYDALDADGNGRYLLIDSLANLRLAANSTAGVQAIDNKSAAIFGQANWHFTDALTLTTGARITREDRNNVGSTIIKDNGSAPELNPSSINGVVLGGFDPYVNTSTTKDVYVRNGLVVTASTPGAVKVGAATLDPAGKVVPTFALTTDPTDTAAVANANAAADAVAKKYFGASQTWATLTAKQKQQVIYAQQIRRAALGALYNATPAEPYRHTQPTLTLSPSYKFNPDVTGYFSFQHGEKAGIAQQYQGVSYLVQAEKTNNFELGVKSALLNKTLVLNADVFLSKIRNYQTSVQEFDQYATNNNLLAGQPLSQATAYSGITGNVPKVKVYGIEVDGVYAGIPRTTLRFSGAYNKAVYESFPNAAFPSEQANLSSPTNPYYDASGTSLPGVPKISGNIGVDYHQPVFGDKEVHTGANLAVQSGSYGSSSIYSYIPRNYSVDWEVGLARVNKSFDVSVVVKNLFNNDTPTSASWTSVTPAIPRLVVLQFTGKL
jgi:outer membrane receptor protein involved in Fe transport